MMHEIGLPQSFRFLHESFATPQWQWGEQQLAASLPDGTGVFVLTLNSWKTLIIKVIVSSIKRMEAYQCLEMEPFRSKD